MTTNINPNAESARELARRGDGTFGHQVKNEPEGSLMNAAPSIPSAESISSRVSSIQTGFRDAEIAYENDCADDEVGAYEDFEDARLELGQESFETLLEASKVIDAQQARIAELEAQLAAAQSSPAGDAYETARAAGFSAGDQALEDIRDIVRQDFPDAVYFRLEESDQGSGLMTEGVYDKDGNRLDDPWESKASMFDDEGLASWMEFGSGHSVDSYSSLPESLRPDGLGRYEVFEVNPQN